MICIHLRPAVLSTFHPPSEERFPSSAVDCYGGRMCGGQAETLQRTGFVSG